jgi:hypothetical protein
MGTLGNLTRFVISNMGIECSDEHDASVQQVMKSTLIGHIDVDPTSAKKPDASPTSHADYNKFVTMTGLKTFNSK